jgi:hypothetical protein
MARLQLLLQIDLIQHIPINQDQIRYTPLILTDNQLTDNNKKFCWTKIFLNIIKPAANKAFSAF